MRKYLHWLLTAGFMFVLVWQIVFWSGASGLSETGPIIRRSAMREAPVVAGLILAGETLGAVVPAVRDLGQAWAEPALAPGFERLKSDPDVAMDYIFGSSWNATQRFATKGVYALWVLLGLAAVAWFRRPRQVRMLGVRR